MKKLLLGFTILLLAMGNSLKAQTTKKADELDIQIVSGELLIKGFSKEELTKPGYKLIHRSGIGAVGDVIDILIKFTNGRIITKIISINFVNNPAQKLEITLDCIKLYQAYDAIEDEVIYGAGSQTSSYYSNTTDWNYLKAGIESITIN